MKAFSNTAIEKVMEVSLVVNNFSALSGSLWCYTHGSVPSSLYSSLEASDETPAEPPGSERAEVLLVSITENYHLVSQMRGVVYCTQGCRSAVTPQRGQNAISLPPLQGAPKHAANPFVY